MARPPKPPAISDARILAWMADGSLYFTHWMFPDPILWFRGRVIQAELNQQGGRRQVNGGERYRFQLRDAGKRRRIMRSKLVYMFFYGVVVPEDCRVHHGAGGKLDDSVQNLKCMTDIQHDFWHYGPPDDTPF